jgi:hypothetical protein
VGKLYIYHLFLRSNRKPAFMFSPVSLARCRHFASRSGTSHRSLLPLIHSSSNVHFPLEPFAISENPRRATSKDGSVPKDEEEVLLPFLLRTPLPTTPASPLGLLRPSVTKALLEDHHWQLEHRGHSSWSFHSSGSPARPSVDDVRAVSFSPHIIDRRARTEAILRIVKKWNEAGQFKDILGGKVFDPQNFLQ